jgi:ankyrin repeat protein
MMLKLGADINKKNAAQKTPLDLAKEHNNEEALAIIEKFISDKVKKARK